MATYDDYNQPPATGGYQEPTYQRGPSGSSGKALASLLLGLASFCAACLTGIPAIILGFMALGDIRQSHGRMSGSGMAYTGIITGLLGTLCCLGLVGAGVYVYSIQQEGIKEIVRSNRVVQEHLGKVDSVVMDDEKTNEVRLEKAKDIFEMGQYWVFDVEGSKGKGTVQVRVEQLEGTLNYKLKGGTLEMPNGEKFDLLGGRANEKAPPK